MIVQDGGAVNPLGAVAVRVVVLLAPSALEPLGCGVGDVAENVEVVRGMLDAWAKGDRDTARTAYDPNAG